MNKQIERSRRRRHQVDIGSIQAGSASLHSAQMFFLEGQWSSTSNSLCAFHSRMKRCTNGSNVDLMVMVELTVWLVLTISLILCPILHMVRFFGPKWYQH